MAACSALALWGLREVGQNLSQELTSTGSQARVSPGFRVAHSNIGIQAEAQGKTDTGAQPGH